MPLQSLSNELLLQIIDWVSRDNLLANKHNNGQDLAHLALCSRSLNALTTSVLYETFYFRGENSLPLLLQRVIKDPEIGRRFKRIVGESRFEDESLGIDILSEVDVAACEQKIREWCPAEDSALDWIAKFREGDWDAFMALLLPYLENLREINLESFGSFIDVNERHLAYILNRAARLQNEGHLETQGSLSKLHRISVTYHDTENGLDIPEVLPFMKLKSVKKLFVHMLQGEDPLHGRMTSQIEDLSLQYSCVESDTLVKLLRSFPNLKRLSYENGGAVVGDHEFLPQKFGEGIQHLKETLETLAISDDESYMGVIDPLPIGPLTDFNNLRALMVSAKVLLGDPESAEDREIEHIGSDSGAEDDDQLVKEYSLLGVLPPSLVELTIKHCQGKELGYLRELLEQRDKVPLLKRVLLAFDRWRPAPAEESEEVKRLFEDAGIVLLINRFSQEFELLHL
ncbi:hypothetical protein B0O99DRAFT_692682 [Bisporella sp. PMI_857]|nr:hypothetical protein B0O99DRAFT_692682 [Bisporella sp. PMI_857]